MALVTIQLRTNPTDVANTDSNPADADETRKVNQSSRSECQSTASPGTAALMLGSNERLRVTCEDQPGATSPSEPGNPSNPAGDVRVDDPTPNHAADGPDAGEAKVEAGLSPSRPTSSCSSGSSSSSSDIQQHLQSMFYLLRPEETLKMAVKLESLRPGRTRYLVVVSRTVTSKRHSAGTLYPAGTLNNTSSSWPSSATAGGTSQQPSRPCSALSGPTAPSRPGNGSGDSVNYTGVDTFVSCPGSGGPPCRSEQCDSKTNSRLSSSLAAGTMPQDDRDCAAAGQQSQHPNAAGGSGKEIEESCLLGIDCNERTTVGLVLKVLADTSIRLDGDGGFSVSSCGKQHIFKPVSVQAMWSALQTLHKVSFKAFEHNLFAGGPSHDWVGYYETHIDSDRSCLNEWNAMDSLESRRPPSPGSIRSKPTEREETESVIRSKLKEVMMSVDLDDVTSKFIRGRLEELLDMDLGEYKPFIDEEMLVILGQMDAPTEIFDHVYLGSEWNASNLEELQRNGVRHILNVTREIDNFFPGLFHYCNVRVYDDEKTDLLRHWDNTFKYITRAKMEGSKVLVHCKMGISRSASVVIAYAMKANNWDFERALRHVKEKRSCIKPNKNFLMQLETYQGMLDAMKNKEKLQRSKSETNLKLAGAKEGRSLPGSEPTPLIQALNGAGSAQMSPGSRKSLPATAPTAVGAAGQLSADAKGDKLDGPPAALSAMEVTEESAPDRGRSRSRPRPPSLEASPLDESLPKGPDQRKEVAVGGARDPGKTPRLPLAGANTYRPWNQCDGATSNWTSPGRVCSRPSGVLKRHRSLSPDSLNPRWPCTDRGTKMADVVLAAIQASRTRTILGLDDPVGPGAGAGGSGRRKQQSYSLEHLHGSLEMRSPCTETKTIRMPCGNGQNYSVSPNQIVHLQDKLPVGGGPGPAREPVPASPPPPTGTARSRSGSSTRKLFTAYYSSCGNPPADGSAPAGPPSPAPAATSAPTAVPSTSAPTATTFSVKTIVSELEWNSGSSRGPPIPVAPPPASDAGSGPTGGVAIPIASVAAEAAAVAVATAIREASRKDGALAQSSREGEAAVGEPTERGNDPKSQPPEVEPGAEPICWTSSTQIIQNSSAGPFPERTAEETPAGGDRNASPPNEETPARTVADATTHQVSRQCSWSSCDSATTFRNSPSLERSHSQRRSAPAQSTAGVVDPQALSGGDREDIPWHPGTVKRTKERIEERSTTVGSTLRWAGSSSSAELLPRSSTSTGGAAGPQQKPQQLPEELGFHKQPRGRQGMGSTTYARLSASAPDSYNMYADKSGSRTGNPAAPGKLQHQHSFTGPGDGASPRVDSTSYCLRFRVTFRSGDAPKPAPASAPDPDAPPAATDEESFHAGKVRNLKMSFEAKSHDRGREPKKVRSLPSSPVAVHVAMNPAKPSGATTVTISSSGSATSPTAPAPQRPTGRPAQTPPEDVTVRDLVDRYEEHGPRLRPTGSSTLTRGQRPRSVFEPLKGGSRDPQLAGGKPFAHAHLLSHSTTTLRLDDSARPPVPPLVRGLVLPGANHGSSNNNNNNNNNASSISNNVGGGGGGGGGHKGSNVRNNNNSSSTAGREPAVGFGVVGGKRTQQHGRTHPLAKISPGGARHHHHNHHHHHHHHQYSLGQLQPHRLGGAPGPGGPGTGPAPSATVTANVYNTM